MTQIKNCPFCDYEHTIILFDGVFYRVTCKSCLARGPQSTDETHAIYYWNTRLKDAATY